jgi:symplekin
VIPRIILVLIRLITDPTPVVAKRALRASGRILRATLKWAAIAPVVTPDMENAWAQISSLKIQIINMIDSDNDG